MSATSHDHGVDVLAAAEKFEQPRPPTKIETVATNYGQRLAAEYYDLATAIRTGVRDRNVLSLGVETLADPPMPFEFTTDSSDAKVEAFQRWLAREQQRGVLQVVSRDGNTYVQSSYSTGLRWARARLREAGVDVSDADLESAFNLPVHQDSLQLLFTRNYQALEGITEATSKEIGRVLTDGFREGVNPNEMARRLTDRVDSIGITRARTLARTETAYAHHTATVNRYERYGVETVDVLTYNPCEVCIALAAGNPYPIEEAAGLLPAHPRCKCAIAVRDVAS